MMTRGFDYYNALAIAETIDRLICRRVKMMLAQGYIPMDDVPGDYSEPVVATAEATPGGPMILSVGPDPEASRLIAVLRDQLRQE